MVTYAGMRLAERVHLVGEIGVGWGLLPIERVEHGERFAHVSELQSHATIAKAIGEEHGGCARRFVMNGVRSQKRSEDVFVLGLVTADEHLAKHWKLRL